jgi:hypothetical protein
MCCGLDTLVPSLLTTKDRCIKMGTKLEKGISAYNITKFTNEKFTPYERKDAGRLLFAIQEKGWKEEKDVKKLAQYVKTSDKLAMKAQKVYKNIPDKKE